MERRTTVVLAIVGVAVVVGLLTAGVVAALTPTDQSAPVTGVPAIEVTPAAESTPTPPPPAGSAPEPVAPALPDDLDDDDDDDDG
jgi:hypothetical protein